MKDWTVILMQTDQDDPYSTEYHVEHVSAEYFSEAAERSCGPGCYLWMCA